MKIETVPIESLNPHPRNYRKHPEDQLAHIVRSIEEHGFYRNVVIAQDDTILAGHGVVEAAAKLGLTDVPVIRLDITADDPKALKVLAGDNEISNLAEINDRQLTEILKELTDVDDLLGTGFDEQQLAALVMVSRPASEIADMNEAGEWVGMPDYDNPSTTLRIIIHCDTPDARQQLVGQLGLHVSKPTGEHQAWSAWWPPKQPDDLNAVRMDG